MRGATGLIAASEAGLAHSISQLTPRRCSAFWSRALGLIGGTAQVQVALQQGAGTASRGNPAEAGRPLARAVREKTGHALAGARQWIPAEDIRDPVKSLLTGLPLDLRFRTKGQLAIDIRCCPRPA